MRTLTSTLMAGLIVVLVWTPRASSDDAEWADLFGRDLRDWTRSGTGSNPWRLTSDQTLICEGASEVYIPEREFFNGTLKFEYRFQPNGEKKGFKAAIWARRTLSGTGCKLALGDDCGTMSATFQGSSDRTKTVEEKPAVNAAKPIGDWNRVRIVLQGRSVTFYVNGKQVAAATQSDSIRGMIALEADQSEVEFRNMLWQEGK